MYLLTLITTILAAGGFIIQLLPGTDDKTITAIEQRLQTIEPISKLIQKGLSPEEILEEVLGKENVKFLETMPVEFKCQCSEERIANAIISLGQEEIQSMIEEDDQLKPSVISVMRNIVLIKSSLKNERTSNLE